MKTSYKKIISIICAIILIPIAFSSCSNLAGTDEPIDNTKQPTVSNEIAKHMLTNAIDQWSNYLLKDFSSNTGQNRHYIVNYDQMDYDKNRNIISIQATFTWEAKTSLFAEGYIKLKVVADVQIYLNNRQGSKVKTMLIGTSQENLYKLGNYDSSSQEKWETIKSGIMMYANL